MALLWKERELRNQKAEEGLLWCKIHQEFLSKEQFAVWNAQGSNYGHRAYCKKCEMEKYYYKDKDRWTKQVKERNAALKAKYVDLMGGKCQKCGYDESIYALEFHHIDRQTKDKEIGTMTYIINKYEEVCDELAKCCMLCSNCHRTYTANVWDAMFVQRADGIGYTIQMDSIVHYGDKGK